MNAIKTRNLSKSYGLVKALSGVSFDVERGEVIGLLGPNGAGKTTLMKILTGYLQPSEGAATVTGVDVVASPQEVQAKIGYLPESAPLYGDMIVQEYLQMMAELRSIPLDRRRRYLSEAIYATGIEEYLTRPIRTLSKGYRQRVGIAQAIAHKPELLILDEPTTGLDPAQIVEIRQLIKAVAQESTVILSTHILPEVEATCERVLIIVRGTLREDRPLGELREAYASNVAVLSVAGASGVRDVLAKIDGVSSVEDSPGADGYVDYRVSAAKDVDLCPAIFRAIRNKDWTVGQLRDDHKSLETVFRELAESDEGSVR